MTNYVCVIVDYNGLQGKDKFPPRDVKSVHVFFSTYFFLKVPSLSEFFGLHSLKISVLLFLRLPLKTHPLRLHWNVVLLLGKRGPQGHPRATSKPASWREQEVPSEHRGFLLSAGRWRTLVWTRTHIGGKCHAGRPCSSEPFFPSTAGTNVMPLHLSSSHWWQPFFCALSCINTVWVICELENPRVGLHPESPAAAFQATSGLHC